MLPYVGPLLMILLPFKLFRPKKTADFWGLHVIGLVCVGLGCVLADDAVFGALLVLYLFFSLWCLALFVLDRNLLQSASTLERAARLPRWPQVASWAFPILIVALIVFMYTPRSGTTWQFSGEQRNKIEVGMPDDS